MKRKLMLKLFALVTAMTMSATTFVTTTVNVSAATIIGSVTSINDENYYGLTFSSDTVTAENDILQDTENNTLLNITYLGKWKYSNGLVPNGDSDRPSVSGGAYASGCAIQFTATQSASVIIDRKLGNNKTLIIQKDGVTYKSFSNTSGASYSTTKSKDYAFDVVPGSTYIAYCTGTGDPYYGIYCKPVESYNTVYDIPAALTSNIQNATGTISPTTTDAAANAPKLQVDATSGKLGVNTSDWAQINVGTILTLPRVAAGSTIAFNLHNTTELTIGEEAYTNGDSYTTTADGDVVMTCTSAGYIKSITVSGPAFLEAEPEYTTVYQFGESNGASNININGVSGTVAATTKEDDANAPEISVDATHGKLYNVNRGDQWAQINAGTILTLPGVTSGTKITLTLYDSTALTINGVEYTNGQTYTAKSDGDVAMTCSTGGYISTITVVGPAFKEAAETTGYTNTWYFGKSNGAPEFALQKSAEYTYTSNEYSVVINTDSGKLNNATRTDNWAQCNDGTVFKVPVYPGSKISWVTYNTGEDKGFNVDGVLYNSYYIATEEGEVNLSAHGITYLDSLKIEPISLYEVNGTVAGASVSNLYFTSNGNSQKYSANVISNEFTISVPADSYTLSLSASDPYVISDPTSVTVSESQNIGTVTLVEASAQTVTGNITNPPTEDFVLTFTGSAHTKTLSLSAAATTYTAELDPDTYTISSSVGTLSTLSQESFTVVSTATSHNIYYPETIPAATSVNITVDKNATVVANTYNSLSDALVAAKAGNISAPVITLTSGQTYQEQVIVDMSDVTLKTSSSGKAKITFYYGIDYGYYSLNSSGYYNKDRAMTRNSVLDVQPARWGTTVLVTKNANNFRADNIIFENSFNQYYTDEEVVDGVTARGKENNTTNDRQAQTVAATAKVATERAAAIAFENSPSGCELYNCEFIGSQDTFYTSGKIYVKDCSISGNTDYIFGGGNVIFDNCNLIWNGYSDQNPGGYITASKDGTYIFRNCTIKDTEGKLCSGNLGRDWGGTTANVYFMNTTNSSGATSYKWTNMGGAISAGTANLHIYDFDPVTNANYSSTGSTGANVNGLLSFENAKAIYEGVTTKLNFTPAKVLDAVTDSLTESNEEAGLYGALVTLTKGTDADNLSSLTWFVNDGTTTKSVTPATSAIGSNDSGIEISSSVPTLDDGTSYITMMFRGTANNDSYNVVTVAQ